MEKQLNDLLELARKKVRAACFLAMFHHSYSKKISICDSMGNDIIKFETFAELKNHIESLPDRNEILYRKFSLEV